MPLSPMPPPIFSTRSGGVFAFLPDGERLVLSGTGPKSVARILLLSAGQDILTFEKPPPNVRGSAASQDGTTVALATIRDRVTFYDAQTGIKRQTLKTSTDAELSGLEFAPGSCDLLHSSWRGLTAMELNEDGVYAARPLRVSAEYPDNTMYYAIAFAASGDRFASTWNDRMTGTYISLSLWPSGDEVNRIPIKNYPHSYCLDKILFSPDDQSLLFTAPDGSAAVWSLSGTSGSEQNRLPIDRPSVIPRARGDRELYVSRLCFSHDGNHLAYCVNSVLGLWAWPSGKHLGEWQLPGSDPIIHHLGFSLTGQELVVSCYGPGISVYRVADLLNVN